MHRTEALYARNEHLRTLANTIHDLGQRLSFLCFGGNGGVVDLDEHLRRVCADHSAGVAALRARDADAAERVAAAHVHLFRQRVVAYFEHSAPDGMRCDVDRPSR